MLTNAEAVLWVRKDLWNLDEAALLLSGITPDSYLELDKRCEQRNCSSEEDFQKQFRIFSDAQRSALEIKKVLLLDRKNNISPTDWVKNAKNNCLDVPKEIEKIITSLAKFKKKKPPTEGEPITENWILLVQQEAARRWVALIDAGATPTKNNMKDDLEKWCRKNNVITRTDITPKAATIYKHALRKWEPPPKIRK